MKESYSGFLPIGTVVMLKNGKKRVMITGFCSVDTMNKTKIYNYSGCLYPEGFLRTDRVCLFDHNQIEKIYHLGLVDEEEKQFKEKLVKAVEQMQNK